MPANILGAFVTPISILDDIVVALDFLQRLEIPELWRIIQLPNSAGQSPLWIITLPQNRDIASVNSREQPKITRYATAINHLEEISALLGHNSAFARFQDELNHLHKVIRRLQQVARKKRYANGGIDNEDPKVDQIRQTARLAIRIGHNLRALISEQMGFGIFADLLTASEDALTVFQALYELGGANRYVDSNEVQRRSFGKEAGDMPRALREQLVHRQLLDSRGKLGIKLTKYSLMVLENAGVTLDSSASQGQCCIKGTLGMTYRLVESRCVPTTSSEDTLHDRNSARRDADQAIASI